MLIVRRGQLRIVSCGRFLIWFVTSPLPPSLPLSRLLLERVNNLIKQQIPLPPADIVKIWNSLKPYSFTSTHGAFHEVDVRDPNLKGRVLESAKIAIAAMGYVEHEILAEEWK